MVFTRRQSSRLAATAQNRLSPSAQSLFPLDDAINESSKLSAVPAAEGVAANADEQESQSPSRNSPSKAVGSYLSTITQRTPKHRSPIQPSREEMHPQLHHKSTTTPYDEARWLGIFNMGARTVPAKTTSVAAAAAASPTPANKVKSVASTDFKFTFKRQSSVELSPEAKKMMQESRDEAAMLRVRMSALPPIPDTDPSSEAPGTRASVERKIAKPKSRVGRYSAAHMAEFKKMDSIENHPSAWRLKNTSLISTTKSLKRSPSKAELDKSESSPFITKAASTATVGFHGVLSTSKRVKQTHADDASKARPMFQDMKTVASPTPKSVLKTGLPKPKLSHLMTPTKASLARSQSVKVAKMTRLPVPSAIRSKSARLLRLPQTPPGQLNGSVPKPISPTPVKTFDLKEDTPIKAPSQLLKSPSSAELDAGGGTPKIKSILRTPHRLYSDDPSLIAAGTHLATPPEVRRHLAPNPATAPTIRHKHVDFTASACEKAERDELKATSAEPESLQYPNLPAESDDADSRRSTISSLPIPGAFTFRAGTPIIFSNKPASNTPTIRTVRSSDVGLVENPKGDSPMPTARRIGGPSSFSKRKLEFLGQIHEQSEPESEKENREEDDRPAKKMRKMPMSEPAAPGLAQSPQKRTPGKLFKRSKLPTGGTKRVGGLSAARLNLLATPKRRG